ncbi:hypothetical protein KKF91_16260 [Myxococcota bacterium]|nr:hypothetical protein [Myxococcota bacterium]MBU1432090.1 hypothetical protein [Myxococcota bacterium]MBU1897668.1 hypothetical protein [Myxococcota bacterium]
MLKAHFSSINVTCVDQGLSLALDDLPPVACPTRFEDVLEGRHALKIKVGARSLLTRELEVKPGPTIDVQVPAFPQLFIKGSGAGEVLVGGLPVGRIGAPALIVAGEHAVVVRRPRCPDQAQSVTARPGERVYLTLGPCSTPSAASPGRGPWPWVLAGSSALFLGGGLLLYAKNQDAAKAGDQAQTELYYGLTLASYGLGGAALVGGLAWGLWPASPQSEAAYGLSWSGVW